MADSKISSLPLSPYVLDKDLMVIVTGHLEDGAFPKTVKVPVSYLRRYIIRLNLLSNPQSGIAHYYNSGLNILTTWTTGIHAVPGNNMHVEFSANTPAGQRYGKTGHTSHSGIISTTGLNAHTDNLIAVEYESEWPYSGVIYHTGLNAAVGNNIEIVFNTGSPAAIKYGNAGGKYHSGIISTTGLNARHENLMAIGYESSWPYSGIIYNTGLNAVIGNNIDIQFRTDSAAGTKYGGTGGKYHSGIISTTGLNSRTDNLVSIEYEPLWPYSGIIYHTGLNARAGNLIEITHSTSSVAHALYGGAGGKYSSGIISITGINANPGSGIYFVESQNWPFKNEIHSLEKYYEVNSNYNLYTDSNAVDMSFPIPITISTGINIKQLNTYSKIKVNGYYSRITFDTYLPVPQPTRQDVTWDTWNLTSLKQGCAVLGMVQAKRYAPPFNNTLLDVTNALYDYSQEFSELQPRPVTDAYGRGGVVICSNHSNAGTYSSVDMYNSHFLAFYNVPPVVEYPFQDIVGFVGVLNKNTIAQILPTCTVQWFGTVFQNGSFQSVTETVSADGSIQGITINGHRFMEVKPL